MAKYYVNCGSLQIIYSTNKDAHGAAERSIWETNENDTLDEYFYVDERGFRDYTTADPNTMVFPTEQVIRKAGWSLE